MIPIVVFTHDRLRYLDITLKSISATVPEGVPVYVSCDRPNEDTVRYLTEDVTLTLEGCEFPNENSYWEKQIGYIPNLKTIQSIRSKVNVIIRRKNIGTQGLGFTLKNIIEELRPSHIIRIEDDAVFKPNWYQDICLAAQDGRIGILSGFRHFFPKGQSPILKNISSTVQEVVAGYTGGVCLCVSTKLCEIAPDILNNNITEIESNDDFWINRCRKKSLKLCVLAKGVCQHIGVSSTIYKHKGILSPNGLDRIDHSLTKPFAIADEVRHFGCVLMED